MRLRSFWRKGGVALAVITIAALSPAQNPFNVDTDANAAPKPEVGGAASIDLIRLQGTSPGVPLRNGNVMPGSEMVSLNGEPLVRGRDYSIDHEAGVIYLMRAQKPGMALSVSYRYSKTKGASTTARNGFAGFKFDLLPGGLKAVMGLGMAERQGNGNVLTSNIYGLNNRFSFGGGGTLSGLYLIGDKQKVDSRSQYDYEKKPAGDAGEGQSQFILQNLATKFSGGQVYADYQDISENFSGFAQVEDSGIDKATTGFLRNERGMTRMGYGLKDVKFGSNLVSAGFRNVKDEDGEIGWTTFGFQNGGLKLNYDQQEVGDTFKRFGNIREKEREQLKKEIGMSRENLAASFATKLGTLSFTENSILDRKSGEGIERQSVALDTRDIKFKLDKQEIGKGFLRTQHLYEAERGQWGRELGLKRQNMGLQAALLGKGVAPIQFQQNLVADNQGGFAATDVQIPGRGWSLSHVSRNVDPKFHRLGSLTEGEWDGHIKAITSLYDAKTFGFNPGAERPRFLASAGLDREVTRFAAEPFKAWNLSLERMSLKSPTDGVEVDTASINGRNFGANYRAQRTGKDFNLGQLMTFEQARVGVVSGLERTEFGFNMGLGGSRKFEFGQMDASVGDAEASRQRFKLTDKKLDVEVVRREVSNDFHTVGALVDTEKDLLLQMKGFKQQEARVRWEIAPNLRLDFQGYDADNDLLKQGRTLQQTSLSYTPNAKLGMSYSSYEYGKEDPMALLFAHKVERFHVFRDFDKLGKITYQQEKQDFAGSEATKIADMRKTYVAYEKQLDAKTSVRAERTETNWTDGNHENVNANTISTQLSQRAGVSVTDTKIDRKGDERDETKRNYGVWYEVAKNVRVSWGYARHLNGDQVGTMNSTVTLSNTANTGIKADQVGGVAPAEIGNFQVAGGYGVNRWDNLDKDRTQSFSNVRLQMTKPAKVWFINDFTFNFGYDTAADLGNWLRENRNLQVGGRIGSNTFGYQYRSQMAPNNSRGIDRVFQFSTDMSEKRALRASLYYKVRTLPDDQQFMIRNFTIAARPLRNLEISNQLMTNPEVQRGDVMLGSIVQGNNMNRWKLDWKNSPNLTIGGTWDQMKNEQTRAFSTTSGLNIKLFEKSGSPVELFFGGEDVGGNLQRRYTHRYSLSFNQRPGPNQMFSFFIGNLSYLHGTPKDQKRENLTLRLDYQVRF